MDAFVENIYNFLILQIKMQVYDVIINREYSTTSFSVSCGANDNKRKSYMLKKIIKKSSFLFKLKTKAKQSEKSRIEQSVVNVFTRAGDQTRGLPRGQHIEQHGDRAPWIDY